jgi:hypothetical protein
MTRRNGQKKEKEEEEEEEAKTNKVKLSNAKEPQSVPYPIIHFL